MEQYSDKRFFQQLYGRFFLYMEIENATRMFTAYEDDHLIGLLTVRVESEKKRYHSLRRRLYLGLSMLMMLFWAGRGTNSYGDANENMLKNYKRHASPDGEICFLAVDPKRMGKGIGTKLLKALERTARGKEFYLFTDDNCTYQFYDHRDFTKEGEEVISMEIEGKQIPLTCMLYSIRYEE